jgi:hypothetical protein
MSYNLAILHHHLNRGGVTQVIANHLRALDDVGGGPERVLIVYGGRRSGWPDELAAQLPNLELQFCEVPEVDYDEGDTVAPRNLADRLQSCLMGRGFRAGETVVHVHNHTLGKNVSLPGAIEELAVSDYHLLLQIHDFPEDFRPQNYRRQMDGLGAAAPVELGRRLYPQAAQIHYAVLNGRDRNLLAGAGVAAERLHLLPNPVHEFGPLPAKDAARTKLADRLGIPASGTLLLYPVRGIRRKNVGEALLWSALFESDVMLGLTLSPMNPLEQPHYDRWVRLADELSLPFRFGLGEEGGLGFTENLSAADGILTTSLAEGFGMVFLETWLAGRTLLGRDLPEITADFKEAGVQFTTLYPEFRVPVEWVEERRFVEQFEAAYCRVLDDYGRVVAVDAIRGEIGRLVSAGTIDFAYLDSDLQSRVIRRVATDPASRNRLLSLNPGIAASVEGARCPDGALLSGNAAAVRAFASLEVSGRRLEESYEAVRWSSTSPIEGLEQGASILEEFLDVSRFHPVRVES